MEHFTAVCAAPASVFVSRFLCDWRFLYTKIGGLPTRLPQISATSGFESKQTKRACAVLSIAKGTFWLLVCGAASQRSASFSPILPTFPFPEPL